MATAQGKGMEKVKALASEMVLGKRMGLVLDLVLDREKVLVLVLDLALDLVLDLVLGQVLAQVRVKVHLWRDQVKVQARVQAPILQHQPDLPHHSRFGCLPLRQPCVACCWHGWQGS